MDEFLQPVPGLRIPVREVVLRTTRSGGPGGQHANVTESRVDASFDVQASTALGEAQRALLQERFGPIVRVGAQDERSQLRNRQLALERMERKLAAALRPARPRVASKVPAREERKRLEAKRRRAAAKRARRPPDAED